MRKRCTSPIAHLKEGSSIIEWISNWVGGIIIAVIIGTIIEMLLPEGNSKKYIKVVIGIYVIFTIVSPLVNIFIGKEIEVPDVLDLNKYVEKEVKATNIQNIIQSDNTNNIKSIYIEGIKGDMKEKIKTKGYNTNSIDVDISDDDNYKIVSVILNITKIQDESENVIQKNEIEPVKNVNKIEINIGEEENSENKKNTEEKKERRK